MPDGPFLGVALDGAGAHPAAWRAPGGADGLFTAERLEHLARSAEDAGFDFVTFDDGFDPPIPESATLPGRLDALLALARIAPATTAIGLLPTVTTTHTEPFHISKNIATLDLVSAGRAGWHVAVSTTDEAARAFGREVRRPLDELWAEADDAIEVVNRLWDSWEDDAVIRDRASGRYVDRDKLHYIDFAGRFFSVRGPSITPRSPQGQPLVAITAGNAHARDVAARRADIVFVEAADARSAQAQRDAIRHLAGAGGRDPDTVAVLAVVRIGEPALRAELDRHGTAPDTAAELVADAATVAATLKAWSEDGAVDGFLLRPDVLPATLQWLAADVLPRLDRDRTPAPGTLRERFGLPRPANRYAAEEVAP